MNTYSIPANDNYALSLHTFDIPQPKAVVQIIHGMEEHQERYEDFALFLNQNGYCVVTSDMRGHGKDAKSLGHFKDKNGYKELTADQIIIRKFIAEKYTKLPVYLFAHSMGTIISRVLLQSQSMQYDKVVLSGYPNYQKGAYFGIPCSSLIRILKGATYKSAFLQKLSVGAFNKAIANPSTDVDWVCSNPDTIQSYIKDPLCGIGFTCAAFNDLYHLVLLMHKPRCYHDLNATMPILMIHGTDDPCVGGDKGSKDSINILKQAGFQNITKIDYPNMRHEILNETEHQKVYQDILRFYENKEH